MAAKKLIDPKEYKEFLQKRILDMYEEDALPLACAVENCMFNLEALISASSDAPLIDPAKHEQYLKKYIKRLQKLDAPAVTNLVTECLDMLCKQADANSHGSSAKIQPSCPYCGTKMVSVTRQKAHPSGNVVRWNSHFHCKSCFSTSPVVNIDCVMEVTAIDAAREAAMRRNVLAEEVVSREKYETVKADRDSWKDAFGESNEKNAEEAKRREAVESENRRLQAIIVQHLPGDSVCKLCRFFPQCKQEALEDDLESQKKTRFWTCDGYSQFAAGEV